MAVTLVEIETVLLIASERKNPRWFPRWFNYTLTDDEKTRSKKFYKKTYGNKPQKSHHESEDEEFEYSSEGESEVRNRRMSR